MGIHRVVGRRAATLAAVVALVAVALGGCRAAPDDDATADLDADVASDAGGADVDLPVASYEVDGADSGPRVTMHVEPEGADTFRVAIHLRSIDDLFGVACHLRFDPAAVAIVSAEGHGVLGGEGWAPRTLVKVMTDRVLLGAARVREGGSPWGSLAGAKVGNQKWVTLVVKRLNTAEATIDFDLERCLARASSYERVELAWPTLKLIDGGAR